VKSGADDEELLDLFAGFGVDRDSAAHFRGRLRKELLINRCEACGIWRHPPRPLCASCWSDRIVPTQVSGDGVIYLTLFLHQGPPAEGVDYSIPYPVVTAELDEQPGLRFTTTVVGANNEAISIGERVRLDWIERGGVPLPVFRLTADSS
jgi:uncharacterized OB-fold protein